VNENQNILELCRYRIRQADEAISESALLMNAGHYRGAINRAYYAMFYATQVLIVLDGVKIRKHSGVLSYFDREFVKTGRIDRTFSKWLHRLFDLRQDADYGDMYEPTKEQCEQALENAREFVERIQIEFETRWKDH
jgi:uncharacterized protein (UPF0332 family)